MRVATVVPALLIVLGCVFVAFGLAVGDEASNHTLYVEGPVDADETQTETVTAYARLDSDVQDAFRQAVERDGNAPVSRTADVEPGFVRYRDASYRVYTAHGDADMTRMVFSLGGGFGLILVGAVGWIGYRRYTGQPFLTPR